MGALEDWKLRLLGAGGVTVVQDLVDAYAAQHPTNPDRRNRQSVAIHLMSLCAGIEHRLDGTQRPTGSASGRIGTTRCYAQRLDATPSPSPMSLPLRRPLGRS